MPTVYKEVLKNLKKINKDENCPHLNYPLNFLLEKNETELNIPNESNLTVTKVSESFDKIKSLNNIKDDCIEIIPGTFGNICDIKYKEISASRTLGNLPNVFLSLNHIDNLFYDCLKNIIDGHVLFIDVNECPGIIDVLKDNFGFNDFLKGISYLDIRLKMSEKSDYLTKHKRFSRKYQDMLDHLENYVFKLNGRSIHSKKILLPSYFKNVFHTTHISNDNKLIWNLCLLYDYLFLPTYEEKSYKVNNDIDFFTGDLQNALDNISKFLDKIEFLELDLDLEIPCLSRSYIEKDEDILHRELLLPQKTKCWPCSLGGRMDSRIKKEVHEFKMSLHTQCKDEWLVQVILYIFLGAIIPSITETDDDGKVKVIKEPQFIELEDATIYNFLTGQNYKIKFNQQKFDKYKKRFFNQILKDVFNFNVGSMRKNFLNKITSKVEFTK